MKSITKLMVVAMLLVAALVVAPVAARDIDNNGSTVYIGEKNVNLTEVLNGTPAAPFDKGNLVYYTDQKAGAIGKIIPVTEDTAAKFEIDASTFETRLGPWYAFNGTKSGDITNSSAADGYFLVDKPSAKLDVKLWNQKDNKMSTDSVNGKSVSKADAIAFEIKHNIRLDSAVVTKPENGFEMKIEVKTPEGGTVTTLNGTDLRLALAGTANSTAVGISLKGLEPGTYTAQAKWNNTAAFDSETPAPVTFEIRSKALSISSSKDSVVRGNNFLVTIMGESLTDYYVYVKGPEAASANNPLVKPSQPGVTPNTTSTTPATPSGTKVDVKTNAGGARDIEFNTTRDTKDKQFTIRVEEVGKPTNYDEIKVKVEKGTVSLTTSGTGTYYIGEEITLSGTCTEGSEVWLFMTGPNLASGGVDIENPSNIVVSGQGNSTRVDVEADDTWSKKWNTGAAGLNLDAGSYTIYAVTKDVDKGGLSEVKYDTVSISLRSGFLSATTSSATVARGDKLKISGVAQGNPSNVYIWMFGKNFYGTANSRALNVESTSVESDGTFEYELDSGLTTDLAGGQYFVVIQHPMGGTPPGILANSAGSLDWNAAGIVLETSNTVQLAGLQAPNAATALINLLDSPNIPDTYVKLTFVVEEPLLSIDPIGTKEVGSKFTITGTTNLAPGGTFIVDVTSAAFQPGQKTEASAFSGYGGSTIIEKGDGMNTWSFEVDATDFKPDEYIVNVESIEAGKTATAFFDMIEATEKPTTPPAGETTTPPAGGDETPTEAPPTPGFGALVALAGLGAVAFLVLRRK